MNTPTHILLSVATLTRDRGNGESTYVGPAVLGAVLPDAPMFGFYAVEKFLIGSSERNIWDTRYFLPAWQDFFDLFNSIPIALAGLLICLAGSRRRPKDSVEKDLDRQPVGSLAQIGFGSWRGWAVLFASMLLHMLADLPLHHDDGHRHLWPIWNWRFESPVSYWDPSHFGIQAAAAELLLFVACYVISMRKHKRIAIRVGLTLLAAAHLSLVALLLIAITTW